MTDLGSKTPLQLAHSGYQDTKIFGTKVWGGSLDFNITCVFSIRFGRNMNCECDVKAFLN